MSDSRFERCIQCNGEMSKVSAGTSSPLIMVCQRCGHQEYAEVQVPPPWPATEEAASRPETTNDAGRPERSRFQPSGCPVSVADADGEGTVIPFGWIVLGALLALIVLLWVVL